MEQKLRNGSVLRFASLLALLSLVFVACNMPAVAAKNPAAAEPPATSTSAPPQLSGAAPDVVLHTPLIRFDSVTPGSSSIGIPITVAISVVANGDGPVPSGEVIVLNMGYRFDTRLCNIPLVNGSGSCQFTFDQSGPQIISVHYLGDSYYAPRKANMDYFVSGSMVPTPQITSLEIITHSPDPSAPGEEVLFTVRLLADQNLPADCVVEIIGEGGRGPHRSISLINGEGSCRSSILGGGSEIIWAYVFCGETYTGLHASVWHNLIGSDLVAAPTDRPTPTSQPTSTVEYVQPPEQPSGGEEGGGDGGGGGGTGCLIFAQDADGNYAMVCEIPCHDASLVPAGLLEACP